MLFSYPQFLESLKNKSLSNSKFTIYIYFYIKNIIINYKIARLEIVQYPYLRKTTIEVSKNGHETISSHSQLKPKKRNKENPL